MKKDIIKKFTFPFLLILIGFVVIYSSLALFSEISENVVNQEIRVIDDAIVDFLLSFSSPLLNDAMVTITEMGSVWFTAVVSFFIVLFLWLKEKDKWGILFYLISIGGGGLLILLLKEFFRIDRPSINEQIDAIGYSFPSGHAMGSMILYGFIVYLIIRGNLSRTLKVSLSVVLMLLASLIALSRVYLSAHYPSDVVAGQAGGLAWLMICIVSLEGLQWKTRNNFKPLKKIRKILSSIYKQFN